MGVLYAKLYEKKHLFKNRAYQNIRMGKGEGNGEGWGEGEGKGQGQGGTWKGDLFSSCDVGPKCVLGACFPMIGNFFVADKLGTDGCEKFIGFLDFCGGAGLCSAIGSMILRGKIRERDGIEGGAGGDCCTSFCCLPCVQCQMANHVGVDE